MIKVSATLGRVSRETRLSVFSALSLLALWEAAVDLGWVNSAFVVAPSTIVMATIDLLGSGELLGHISITLTRMFAGFFAGTILGLVIGLAMGWSKGMRALLDPVVSVIYPLPKIALLPLIMLLIGIGERPIVMVIALGAFFPVLVNSVAGVLNIEQIYFDAAQNYGASKFNVFTKVILPGSLPVAFVGIRLALGLSLLLAVVVELAIATNGLGAMLWLSWQTLRIERIYVAIAVIAVLGLVLNPLLKLIGRHLTPWREEQ
ncbi:ABC transporter permease [Chloroflexota bacterium]